MGPATGGARGALGARGRKQRAEATDTSSSAINDGQLTSEQPILSFFHRYTPIAILQTSEYYFFEKGAVLR